MTITIAKRHEFTVAQEGDAEARPPVSLRQDAEGYVVIEQGRGAVVMHPEHAQAVHKFLGEFLELLG